MFESRKSSQEWWPSYLGAWRSALWYRCSISSLCKKSIQVLSSSAITVKKFPFRSVKHARQSDMDYFNDSLQIIPIISNVTLFIPSVSNPIIYVLSNPNYRRAYKAMLCPRRLQNEECPASARMHEFCNWTEIAHFLSVVINWQKPAIIQGY